MSGPGKRPASGDEEEEDLDEEEEPSIAAGVSGGMPGKKKQKRGEKGEDDGEDESHAELLRQILSNTNETKHKVTSMENRLVQMGARLTAVDQKVSESARLAGGAKDTSARALDLAPKALVEAQRPRATDSTTASSERPVATPQASEAYTSRWVECKGIAEFDSAGVPIDGTQLIPLEADEHLQKVYDLLDDRHKKLVDLEKSKEKHGKSTLNSKIFFMLAEGYDSKTCWSLRGEILKKASDLRVRNCEVKYAPECPPNRLPYRRAGARFLAAMSSAGHNGSEFDVEWNKTPLIVRARACAPQGRPRRLGHFLDGQGWNLEGDALKAFDANLTSEGLMARLR